MSKRKPDIEKECVICGERIIRKYLPNGRLESYGDYIRRKHCNQECMGKSNLPRGQKAKIGLKNGYVAILSPDHPKKNKWGYVHEHILLAEKVLGRPLPERAHVHHFTPDQLVICQDAGYHRLLHQRERALKACGHASWIKCRFCNQYGPNDEVYRPGKQTYGYHKECARQSWHEKKQKNRA